MAKGDSYSWIGGTSGSWGTAANWKDLTTGTVATVAPGIDNDATIGVATTISGTGSAASLTIIDGTTSIFGNNDVFLGNINTGALALDGGVNLMVQGGGTLRAGFVSLDSDAFKSIAVDSTSVFEVGKAGSAAPGVLTVDPDGSIAGTGTLQGTTVNNGLIIGNGLSVGGEFGQGALSAPARSR